MKRKFLYNKTLWVTIFWGWTILIVLLTSIPTNPEILKLREDSIIRIDYLEHIFFFGVLSVLYFLAYQLNTGQLKRASPILLISAGVLFASITEIYQIYIPGRGYNPIDLVLNISGLLLGIPVGKWFSSLILNHES